MDRGSRMTEKPRAADPETTGSAPGGSAPASPGKSGATERIVIRDRRKIDPVGKGKPAGRAGGANPPGKPAESATTEAATTQTEPTETVTVEAATAEAEPAAGSATAETSAATQAAAVAEDAEIEAPEAEEEADEDAAATAKPAEAGPLGAELEALRTELDERTRDLQRVSAEYANYRKRVDRDRGVAAEQTTGTVLAALLPVLDDLDRARDHGDLVGPFAAVAEQLIGAVGKFGLNAFGEKGDPFDPTRHEAVAHLTSTEVTEPTCIDVMRRGYLLGDRLLRAALVAVADPE
jgi:molecular chaperone GrpE